jgi:transposase
MSHRAHGDDFREEVLALYREVGLNATERRSGVARSTIRSWARAAGVDGEAISTELQKRNRRASQVAAAKRIRESEEARQRILARVYKIREAAAMRELELLAAGGFDKSSLRDITQSRRFATNDVQLLEGMPTQITATLVDRDQILELVGAAILRAVEVLPEALRDAFTASLQRELLEVREQAERLELTAGGVEDGEVVGDEEAK